MHERAVMTSSDSPPTGFWGQLLRFLFEVIEVTETLSADAGSREKKRHALELVEKWYRSSGIRIRYLPAPIERYVVRRIASDLIDALVEVLNSLPADSVLEESRGL